MVCRKGTAIEMSLDHKPEDPLEWQRILNAGGKVTCDGRVNGGLNLSRAIGKKRKSMSEAISLVCNYLFLHQSNTYFPYFIYR